MKKNWVVSLVYSKHMGIRMNHALRSLVIYAENKDEALGTGIRLIGKEFEGQDWSIYLKAVVEVLESKETLNT